jgi:hypothetical protein
MYSINSSKLVFKSQILRQINETLHYSFTTALLIPAHWPN